MEIILLHLALVVANLVLTIFFIENERFGWAIFCCANIIISLSLILYKCAKLDICT